MIFFQTWSKGTRNSEVILVIDDEAPLTQANEDIEKLKTLHEASETHCVTGYFLRALLQPMKMGGPYPLVRCWKGHGRRWWQLANCSRTWLRFSRVLFARMEGCRYNFLSFTSPSCGVVTVLLYWYPVMGLWVPCYKKKVFQNLITVFHHDSWMELRIWTHVALKELILFRGFFISIHRNTKQ